MNRLSRQKSPYLRQHAQNPIHWYAWEKEAFEKARAENKLIFLSVGYSTCHWCHVMERESFEDKEVAAALNRGYVAIKVDREERPDVDSIYMDAIQAMTGQGGWPMSVFLTPDLKPFFGGTYFPRDRFLWALAQLEKQWSSDPAQILEAGDKLLDWMGSNQPVPAKPELNERIFGRFLARTREQHDPENGGRQGAPKFPPASELRLLLRIHRRSGSPEALEMARKTLDEMARGGIYDALEGGFHRYSTDARWLVPHFEKMLYDQAAMTQAYVEAFQLTGRREYALVAHEILEYVLSRMTSPEGAFFSAEDADSEGEEGRFNVWTDAELEAALNASELAALKDSFEIDPGGNFEHGRHVLALRRGQNRENRSETLRTALAKLKETRARRIRPLRDEKAITSWNGLMIAAMAKAGRVFDKPRYVEAAAKAARFFLSHAESGRLFRRSIEGEVIFPAFLDDHAFLIDGLLELYQATFDPAWLKLARKLQETQDRLFLDAKAGTYFFAPEGDPTLIQRQKEFFDNVMPSPNSVTAMNLLRLHALTLDESYRARAVSLFAGLPEQVETYPWAFPHLLLALDFLTDRAKEVALIGDPASVRFRAASAQLQAAFSPNAVFAGGAAGTSEPALLSGKIASADKPLVYVCEAQSCQAPVERVADAVQSLAVFKPYTV